MVEFRDEHYRTALKIKVDREKDEIAASLGYSVVEGALLSAADYRNTAPEQVGARYLCGL